MAIEEKVIQPDSVNPPEQPVADTTSQPAQPQAPDLSSVKAEYEAKLAAAVVSVRAILNACHL